MLAGMAVAMQAGKRNDDKDNAFPEDNAEGHLRRHADGINGAENCNGAHARREAERTVGIERHRHAARHNGDDQHRKDCAADKPRLLKHIRNGREDIGHRGKGGDTCQDLRPDRAAVLLDLEAAVKGHTQITHFLLLIDFHVSRPKRACLYRPRASVRPVQALHGGKDEGKRRFLQQRCEIIDEEYAQSVHRNMDILCPACGEL